MIISHNDREENSQTTIGDVQDLKALAKHMYTEDEIDRFSMEAAINNHPLVKKPTVLRSKLAYRELLKNVKPTKKYALPGQILCFQYNEPKFKEELEYYDKTPLVIFFGITRTNENTIREIGLNLHYYPPFARMRILNEVYEKFKPYFVKNFNDPNGKPNMMVSWETLKKILRSNVHLAFGVKMYVPSLRAHTYIIPTRLLATAFYTEGHFSKATLAQIRKFWRQS
jgi:hypothetical protein